MSLHVVLGPPASGKTTWVQDRAHPGDIIIDYDRLALALTAPTAPSHNHPRHLAQTTWRARQAAINEALKHCQHTDVYIIHSQPRRDALAKYLAAGAQLHTIDPGEEIVLQRCRDQRPEKSLTVAIRWYAAQRRGELGNATPSRPW